MTAPGWPVAFRGSAAVAAGPVTWGQLRGPGFARLFPDTYVRVTGKRTDLELRSIAAHRYVEGRGVLSGYSAAELLGASCGPADAPAEVTVPGGGRRSHPGLLVHRDRLAPGEIVAVGAVRCTSGPHQRAGAAVRGRDPLHSPACRGLAHPEQRSASSTTARSGCAATPAAPPT